MNYAFIGLLIATALGAYGVIKDYIDSPVKKKTPKARGTTTILVVLIIGGSLVSGIDSYRNHKEAEQLRIQAQEWQTNVSSTLNRIGASQGDEEFRRSYLHFIKQANAQYAARNSAPGDFIKAQEERRKQREQVRKLSDQMTAELLVRVEPVFDLVIKMFDKWVTDLKGAGENLIVTTNHVPLVVRSDSKANWFCTS